MTKYKFLFKPAFFIFNLVFATWMVFRIEEISPSDFGKYKSLFEDSPVLTPAKIHHKQYLKKICSDYKAGVLNSAQLDQKLNKYLTSHGEVPEK
jgi:hypothetical protein